MAEGSILLGFMVAEKKRKKEGHAFTRVTGTAAASALFFPYRLTAHHIGALAAADMVLSRSAAALKITSTLTSTAPFRHAWER